jgi:hypothetical protein
MEHRISGQTDPYGLPLTVTWSEDDQIAHAEWFTPDRSPAEPEWVEEMDALVARIEGRRFADFDDFVRYVRDVTGSRDFD